MLSLYVPILVLAGLAAVFAIFSLGLGAFTGPKRWNRAKLEAYLAGAESAALGALSVENFDQRMRGGAYLTMAMPAYQLA